jgi:hypothetical protein
VPSLPYTGICREGTCFEDLHMSAHLDLVMCSIRAKLCSIHMCCLSLHPYWFPHASHDLFCMLRVWYLYCICMYWNYFMHVHAHIEGLRAYARIPSLACLRTCLLVSKAERAFASVCFYRGMSVYLHFHGLSRVYACFCMYQVVSSTCASRCVCWHVSRAERAPSFSFLRRELSVCLHVP